MPRIFLLSPANCSGRRAEILLSENASFDLAVRLRSRRGAPIGDVFSFVSGLYFRGKLAYARAFASSPDPDSELSGGGVFVITPSAGLRSPDTLVTRDALVEFAMCDIDPAEPRYRAPLERSAKAISRDAGPDCEVVLLGSIASPKYVDILQRILGARLLFPVDFVGRGDMSRGGLMLRAVAAGQELMYAPIAGAIRHGQRPPKLDPATRPRFRQKPCGRVRFASFVSSRASWCASAHFVAGSA